MNQGFPGPNGTIPPPVVCAVGVLILAWLVLIFGPRVSAQIPCHYEVSAIIQAPPCSITGPPVTVGYGMSPNGRYISGYHAQCDTGYESFVFDTLTGQFFTLPRPPGVVSSYANDVNDSGKVVGQHEDATVLGYRGFVYDLASGQYTILPPLPGGAWSEATAINNAGVVCGWRSVGSKNDPVYPWTAFIWSAKDGFVDLGLINGSLTDAWDINEAGIATGTMVIDGVVHTFLWQGGPFTDIGTLAGLETAPFKINEANHVSGRSRVPLSGNPFGTNHAFLWTPEQGMIDVGALPGHNISFGLAINAFDMVGGESRTSGQNNDHAFLWFDGEMRDVNSLVSGLGTVELLAIVNIGVDGRLLAGANDIDGSVFTLLLSPVPFVPADVDRNCRINIDDLLAVINEWGKTKSAADVDQDGVVGLSDLVIVLSNWSM